MRVLVIAQYYPPDMGGGATRAYNVVKGLQENGCDVSVISAAPHYPTGDIPVRYRWKPIRIDYQDGVRIIRTFVPPIKSVGILRRIFLFLSFIISSVFAIFLVNDPDVVWVSNPNILSAIPGLFYKSINKCALVLNVDDLWPESLYDLGLSRKSFTGIIGESLANIAYSKADAITPISPGYIRTISNKYGKSEDRIHVVRAGVDLERFDKVEGKRAKQSCFHVLYLGAFSPAYDFNQVLKAGEILQQHSDIRITLQGAGEIANTIRTDLQIMGLTNVEIVEKIISRDQVAMRLADADALLLPLTGQGFIESGISSKIYEYQAASKPILCCSNGYPSFFVRDSNSGIVIPPGNYTQLAEAIIRLKENTVLANTLGENGRNYAEKNLSLKSVGIEMMKVFAKYV